MLLNGTADVVDVADVVRVVIGVDGDGVAIAVDDVVHASEPSSGCCGVDNRGDDGDETSDVVDAEEFFSPFEADVGDGKS